MLNMIKKLFKKEEPDLSITDKLWEQLHHEQYEEVRSEAKVLMEHKSAPIAKDACKLMAMSFFRQSRYQEALPFFQKNTEYKPEVSDWFNVVTCGTLAKNIEIGRDAFDKAVQLQLATGQQSQPSIPVMQQYYVCALRDVGEYELALGHINELRKIYEQLKITDPTFLHMRGIPFLSHTMDAAVDVFNGLGPSFDANEWIDSFASNIDEDGQEYLRQVKDRIQH